MTWMRKPLFSKRFLVVAAILVLSAAAVLLFLPSFSPVEGRPAAVASDPDGVSVLLAEAARAEQQGRLAEAVTAYEQVLQKVPGFALGYLKLGMIYFRAGLPGKAEEFYLQAIDKGLDDPDVYLHLGYIKESQGALRQALEYYSKGELAGSGNPVLYFNIGNVHAGMGAGAKAVEYFKRAVILDPRYLDAFVNLSIVATQAGEYSDALYYLEKAQKLGYHPPEEFRRGLEEKIKDRK